MVPQQVHAGTDREYLKTGNDDLLVQPLSATSATVTFRVAAAGALGEQSQAAYSQKASPAYIRTAAYLSTPPRY